MIKGIFNTLSGKFIMERRMEMVTNNISNALTSGYKTTRPVLNVENSGTSTGIRGGEQKSSIHVLDSYIQFTNAPLVESGNKFDLGIEGDGFFVVSTKDGNAYTRSGQFMVNNEKKLVTLEGLPVLGQSGEINIEGLDVRVENDGSVFIDNAFTDKIKIVDFENKKGLRNYGNNLFVNSDKKNDETTPEKYVIKQGFYETSNVDVMREMVEIMNSLRAYETYAKVDDFFGDMMLKLINLGRL